MTRFALVPAAALGLAGCGLAPQPADTTPRQEPSPALAAESGQSGDCLVLIWEVQGKPAASPDRSFDKANDQARGGAISCATGSSPSEFDRAIRAIRDAARSGDRRAILEQTGMPLLFIDAEGNRREVPEDGELDTAFDEVFTPEVIALLQQLDLRNMGVTPKQGGDFALGSVWLAVPEEGARPRIVTVNHQALAEAARAADDNPNS